MRHALRIAIIPALAVTTGIVASPSKAWTQEPFDALTPRAIVDSTYAVRLALDALAESIRHGQLDRRQRDDPQLVTAVARLAGVAARRPHPRLKPDLGALWDLRLDLTELQPEGEGLLRARVRVFLATLGDSTGTPVTLTFRRHGDRWDLVEHEGLTRRLADMALRLPGKAGR